MQTPIKAYIFLLLLSAENQKIPLKRCTYEIRWLTGSMNSRCTWVLTTFLAPSNYCRLQWRSCSLPNTFSHISLASSQISPQESFQSHNPIKTNLVSWWWWICPLTNLIICLLAFEEPDQTASDLSIHFQCFVNHPIALSMFPYWTITFIRRTLANCQYWGGWTFVISLISRTAFLLFYQNAMISCKTRG